MRLYGVGGLSQLLMWSLEITVIDLDGSYDGRIRIPICELLSCPGRVGRIGEDMQVISINARASI